MLAVRHPRSWLVIGWTLIALAILVSLLPGEALPNTGMNDKFGHTIIYALLALWFAGIYPRSRYVVIATALFVMGAAIEWAQGAMHLGRQADVRDMVANTGGIAIGLTLALIGLGGWAEWLDGWTRSRELNRD